jgi:hypothetical protein
MDVVVTTHEMATPFECSPPMIISTFIDLAFLSKAYYAVIKFVKHKI